MKYLTVFNNHTDYEDFVESANFLIPNVSYCKDLEDMHYEVNYNRLDSYLSFRIISKGNGKIGIKTNGNIGSKIIKYSINGNIWTKLVTAPNNGGYVYINNLNEGDVIRFKGNNNFYATSKDNYMSFDGGTATFNIFGNIMSLIYGNDFKGKTSFPNNTTYNFCSIFKKTKVISAENLILPATTLTQYCYRAMFSLSTLEKAPQLPATTLKKGVYWYMFEGCSITEAPELLAPILVEECYGHMFISCTNLNYIKCLATSGFNTKNCLENWVGTKNAETVVCVGTDGTFVKDSNTTWEEGVSGIPPGWIVYDNEMLYSPIIECDGEHIRITCKTENASIYYRLNETGEYSLYTNQLIISEDTTVEAYSTKDNNQSSTILEECIYQEYIYKFAGLEFSKGPLYYGTNGYEIKNNWKYNSYNTVYGENNGSYYFNFIEMGSIFENSNFSSSDGDIENSLDPLNGFRLITKSEWNLVVGDTRNGSTVNNSENKHYAVIYLSDVNYISGSARGLLLFPDDEIINGETLSNMDNSSSNTLTESQLNNYLSQGCVFLPFMGHYNVDWHLDDYYLSATEYNLSLVHILKFTQAGAPKDSYYPVRLVRNANYNGITPLEASNQSLNSWNI